MKFYNIISKRSNFLFFFFIFLLHSGVWAQNTSSPYSRYGIGDLQSEGFTKNLGMGGIGFSLNSQFNINFLNPASYSSIALTTFEAAAKAGFYEIKNSSGSGNLNNASFGYFAFAFPLKLKKAGLSIGLIPYSNSGYDITAQEINEAGDIEKHQYEGSGGLNQFYIGVGWSPFKDFSVGVNTSFMFGTIDQVRRVEFPYNNYYSSKIAASTVIHDFYYNLGVLKTFDSLKIAKSDSLVMLDKKIEGINDSLRNINKIIASDSLSTGTNEEKIKALATSLQAELLGMNSSREKVVVRKQKSGWSFNIGLTGSPSIKLNGTHSVLAESYTLINAQEIAKDTVISTEDKSGKLVLPLSIGTGISLRQGTRWQMGADFSLQNWQKYSLFGEKDSLTNSWRVSAGLQWVPNDRSNKSYFNAIQYRFGFHYEQTYLQIHNSQLNDAGVSIGFGFPMKRAATTIQISFEGGKRGTISNNLIELNYLKCSLAFTINDRWFVKSKFD